MVLISLNLIRPFPNGGMVFSMNNSLQVHYVKNDVVKCQGYSE